MDKKIIYVTSRCPFDNWEIWAIREIKSLVDAGLAVTIVPRTSSGKIISEEAKKMLPITLVTPFINFSIVFVLLKKIVAEPLGFFKILRWIFSQSNSFADFLKGLVVLPKSIFISKSLKKERIQHVHAFSTTSVAVVAYILAHELNVPWSITVHSSWHLDKNHVRSTFAQMHSVSFIRTISYEVRNSLMKFTDNLFVGKTKMLHIGVECEELSLLNIKAEKDFIIVSIGWLLPHKGVDISLKSARELLDYGVSNFKWIFYGSGPLLEELMRQAESLNLTKHIEFAGSIDNNKLLSLYKIGSIDLLVQNSIKRFGVSEGIPVSLMEAMAYGVPVIATDCGGTKELVDGKTGFLVSQNNPRAIADAIHELIRSPKHRKALGQRGRDKIVSEFNSQTISEILKKSFI
jgi:colanic acid/amylovoran biosynthesis glycosyltransferase